MPYIIQRGDSEARASASLKPQLKLRLALRGKGDSEARASASLKLSYRAV